MPSSRDVLGMSCLKSSGVLSRRGRRPRGLPVPRGESLPQSFVWLTLDRWRPPSGCCSSNLRTDGSMGVEGELDEEAQPQVEAQVLDVGAGVVLREPLLVERLRSCRAPTVNAGLACGGGHARGQGTARVARPLSTTRAKGLELHNLSYTTRSTRLELEPKWLRRSHVLRGSVGCVDILSGLSEPNPA